MDGWMALCHVVLRCLSHGYLPYITPQKLQVAL